MDETVSEVLGRNYAVTHRRAVEVAERLTDEEFVRSIAPSLHSAAYQLWHMARWTDVFAWILVRHSPTLARALSAEVRGTAQIWEREGIAAAWGLPVGEMGQRDTGTLMDDDAAEALILPDKATVVRYAERAFAFGEQVVRAVPEAALLKVAPEDSDGDSYAENILIYAEHDSRHLGMMEAIAGLLGHRGTTTE